MMTQSVMTQTASLSRTTAGTSTSRAKANNSGFEMFMDRNIKNTDSTEARTKATQDKENLRDTEVAKRMADREDDRSKIDKEARVSEQDKAVKKAEMSQKDSSEADRIRTAQEKEEVPQSTEGMTKDKVGDGLVSSEEKELQEQLLSLLQSIQQAIMKLLQVTPEELQAMLREQGLGLSDLTDPESLQQLLMANKGSTDVMDFLTDGNLKTEFDQLINQVESILKEEAPHLTAVQLRVALEELTAKTEQEVTLPTEGETKSPEGLFSQQEISRDELTTDNGRKEPGINSGNGPEVELLKETEGENGNKQTTSEQGRNENLDRDAAIRYETFLDNLTRTVQDIALEPMKEARTVELREIANQILERIRVVMKPEQTSMEMELNPEHLGKVNLTVVAKEGTMTAQFKVQNELAREAIEGQLQTLRDTLNSQGIKVEAIEVTVTGYTFGQSENSGEDGQATGRNKDRGPKITLEDALHFNEQSEEEESASDLTGLRGTNIDMTA